MNQPASGGTQPNANGQNPNESDAGNQTDPARNIPTISSAISMREQQEIRDNTQGKSNTITSIVSDFINLFVQSLPSLIYQADLYLFSGKSRTYCSIDMFYV